MTCSAAWPISCCGTPPVHRQISTAGSTTSEADLAQAGRHRGGVRAGRSPDALEQRQDMRQAHHDGERGRARGERQPAVEQADQRECEPDREHGQGTDVGPGASQRPQAAALGADAEEIGGDVGAGQQGCRTKHEAGAGTGHQQHQLMDRAVPGADHGQEAAGEEAERADRRRQNVLAVQEARRPVTDHAQPPGRVVGCQQGPGAEDTRGGRSPRRRDR